jgi:hypothetical protein
VGAQPVELDEYFFIEFLSAPLNTPPILVRLRDSRNEESLCYQKPS